VSTLEGVCPVAKRIPLSSLWTGWCPKRTLGVQNPLKAGVSEVSTPALVFVSDENSLRWQSSLIEGAHSIGLGVLDV
jgi:hypothetical protein